MLAITFGLIHLERPVFPTIMASESRGHRSDESLHTPVKFPLTQDIHKLCNGTQGSGLAFLGGYVMRIPPFSGVIAAKLTRFGKYKDFFSLIDALWINHCIKS